MSTTRTIRYKGELDLNGFKIPCFVLDDGTRILSTRGMQQALGVTSNEPEQKSSGRLNEILESKVVSPFISTDSDPSKFEAISFMNGNQKISGYRATALPDICDAVLKGRDHAIENKLKVGKRQEIVFKHADILIRVLAKVGIIALVDEATGYQYERERDELQTILKAYVAEELRAWVKTFPDSYYKEIFRLNGWDYTVQDIRKRPGVVGKWTNKLVYDQLPKGVLLELKKTTPKSAAGNYTARFFQKLTGDIGNQHLQQQLNSVITLMHISDDWKDFISKFNRLVSRRNGQLELVFKDLDPKNEKQQVENKDSLFDKQLKGILAVPKPKD